MQNELTRVRKKNGCIERKCTIEQSTISIKIVTGQYEDVEKMTEGVWVTIKRKILAKKTRVIKYNMTQTTREELENLRKLNKPIVLYKKDDTYFYSFVPHSFSFGTIGLHCCSHGKIDCDNLSPNECTKVHDQKKVLEEYEYIREVFQTLYTHTERFVVLSCENCKYSESTRLSESEFLKHYNLSNRFKI